MTNTALWDAVSKTPPDQTKPITGKPYKGTSPKPYWLMRRATEVFGPCGIGWGFVILDEKLLDGALLEGPSMDQSFCERVHMARVRVWYKWQDQTGEVEHVGQTVFCGRRKDGSPFTDEDAPKKSVTDALTKALSMIGFAGDIFMGRYDDSKYVDELKREDAEAKKPPEKKPSLETRYAAFNKVLGLCKDAADLNKSWARGKELLAELAKQDPKKHQAISELFDHMYEKFSNADPFTNPKKEAA